MNENSIIELILAAYTTGLQHGMKDYMPKDFIIPDSLLKPTSTSGKACEKPTEPTKKKRGRPKKVVN